MIVSTYFWLVKFIILTYIYHRDATYYYQYSSKYMSIPIYLFMFDSLLYLCLLYKLYKRLLTDNNIFTASNDSQIYSLSVIKYFY